MGLLADVTRDNCCKETIERMELLRRDPNLVGYRYVDATPEETESERHAIEMANDMLDDCIAIVKEVCST